MQKYHQYYQAKQTVQSQPIPSRELEMVEDSAGGFVFPVDDWVRLDRFLVLGTEGGSYYASEKKLTIENAQAVQRCIQEDGVRVVNRIVEISEAGRAPKNDPALFALAMCTSTGNGTTRKAAFNALSRVARIGTHLFHFLEYVQGFRGWGRGLRNVVADWYNKRPVDDLAYQVVKYRQRDGWTHQDILRLSHPKACGSEYDNLYKWIVGRWDEQSMLPRIIEGYISAQRADSKDQVVFLIKEYGLTREMVPTEWLNHTEVWEVLLEKMPMTAMIRGLATMTKVGLIAPMSNASQKVCSELRDESHIHKARVHPIAILAALTTYQSGHGARGQSTWQPVSQVVDALDDAFYLAFGNVEPTGKRTLLALDVSGSMSNGEIAGVPGLTPRVGSCAMAMVTARTEPNHAIVAFSGNMIPFEVSPRKRLDDIVKKTNSLSFGGTDCALPMMWALGYNSTENWSNPYTKERDTIVVVDTFIIYTDNETWAGKIHPCQALQEYRRKTGISAKLVVVGMVSNGFSIADPNDGGMLDVVGFDTATPQVISNFAMG